MAKPQHGGKRPGAGRPPTDPTFEPRRRLFLYVTRSEEALLREYLAQIRESKRQNHDSDW